MSNNSNPVLLGSFDLDSAKAVCQILKTNHIPFDLEIDDQPIRNMSPFQAGYGGTFGTGASANIYVANDVLEHCEALLDRN